MPTLPADKSRGFTLMELLIALSLFSAITGILMSSFFQFHRQTDRVESILRLRQELRILEQIIRNDLQSVVYLDAFMQESQTDPDGRKSGIFGEDKGLGDKSRDRLHLHINSYARFHRNLVREHDPELHEVSYYLEEPDPGTFLFKRREEFYLDADITDGERSIIHTLSQNVTSFDVKYFKGAETEPLDEWDSSSYATTKTAADKLPAGVVVTLEIKDKKGELLKSSVQINLRPYMGQFISWR